MKDMGLRTLVALGVVALLLILMGALLYGFGWRPTAGIGS